MILSSLVFSAAVVVAPRPIVIPRPAPMRVAPRPAAPSRVEPTHTPAPVFIPHSAPKKCDEKKEKCK